MRSRDTTDGKNDDNYQIKIQMEDFLVDEFDKSKHQQTTTMNRSNTKILPPPPSFLLF